MNAKLYFIGIMAVFFLGCVQSAEPTPLPIACDDDAMICPDGTTVTRIAPDCEFAACPETRTPPVLLPPFTPPAIPPAPANAAPPSPGICPQLMRPAMGCAALTELMPYYIEPGQSVTIDGGFTTLPSFTNEKYECRWHPSATFTGGFANHRSTAITIQSFHTDYDANFGLIGLARGTPIVNQRVIREEENTALSMTTRIHARAIGTYLIYIQQDTGSNVTPQCSPAQEDAIFSTFTPANANP